LGNAAVPERLRRRRRWTHDAKHKGSAHAVEPARWPSLLIVGAAILSLIALAGTFWVLWGPAKIPRLDETVRAVVPEKSIAVLPFEHLSRSEEHTSELQSLRHL